MTTANDIIKGAFRISGVTVKGETPDADETQDALTSLNDLIDSISNDSLFIQASTLENFSTVSGQTDYTIGAGGDFNTTRPTFINKAYIRSGTIDYPVEVISDKDYADITLKTTQAIPYFLNYTASFPLGRIKLYPAPGSGYTLYLLTEKPITTLTLNQSLSLPPGWNRYLKNQLALEICSEYGVSPPPTVVEIAFNSMGQIKRNAARVKSIDAIPAADNGNVYSGWEN